MTTDAWTPVDYELARLQPDRFAAFERLFARGFAGVYNYARRYASTEEQVRTIAYVVFARLWRHGTALDFDRPLYRVLFDLTRLAMLEYLPSVPASNRFNPDGWQPEQPDKRREPLPLSWALNDAEHKFVQEARSDLFRRAMNKASPRYREAAVLYWCEELPLPEIALRLDLPIETVAMHLEQVRVEVWEPLFEKMFNSE